jgi:hypothetical protein
MTPLRVVDIELTMQDHRLRCCFCTLNCRLEFSSLARLAPQDDAQFSLAVNVHHWVRE